MEAERNRRKQLHDNQIQINMAERCEWDLFIPRHQWY